MQERSVIRKHRPDWFMVLFMSLLMLIGLIVIYAIGPQQANFRNRIYGSDYGPNEFFFKQLINIILSIIAFTIGAKFPHDLIIKKFAKPILAIGIAACALLMIAGALGLGVANCSLGACRWLNFGVSIQPAEILKMGLLLCSAIILGAAVKNREINQPSKLLPVAFISAIALGIIVVIQKDLGTGLATAAIILSMIVVSNMKWSLVAKIIGIALILAALSILPFQHRRDRIAVFFHHDDQSEVDTGHIDNAMLALGSGGLFGVGIGNSVQSTGYLPESISDSIFAIIGETFGFLGLLLVIGLFAALLYTLLRTINHLHDPVSRLIVAGIFGWIAAHVIMNIAAMTGLVPITGITLPFLSAGGTSMIFIAAALGLAFQLSSYTAHTPITERMSNEDISSRRGVGRTRHSSLSSHRRD